MRISCFSVTNYRSITNGYKLPLGDLTVLIGPNNEGKSNTLRALSVAISALETWDHPRSPAVRYSRRPSFSDDIGEFVWGEDFPVDLRSRKTAFSQFTLEFELTSEEKDEFRNETGLNLQTALKLGITISRDNRPNIRPKMQGRASRSFSEATREIVNFVRNRLDLQYIPSVRTEEMATSTVERMLSRELKVLEKGEEYSELLQRIEALQTPVLDALASKVQRTLSAFIPAVGSVRLETSGYMRAAIRQSCRIFVDDGTETPLEAKGDGIKSLSAIALIREAAARAGADKLGIVLAIEEPEAHLHPMAVRELPAILGEIARSNQVIISTHSPLLADRLNPGNNIIVAKGKARQARKIDDVREILGVRLDDNLQSARLILLVEGVCDERILKTWLPQLDDDLAKFVSDGILRIQGIGGASKLRHWLSFYGHMVCAVHVLLDNDDAGRREVGLAVNEGLLKQSEYTLVSAHRRDCELEDLLREDAYEDTIKSEFGVSLDCEAFRQRNNKWTERVKKCFRDQGKAWDNDLEEKVKAAVTGKAVERGINALHQSKRSSIDALVGSLRKAFEL